MLNLCFIYCVRVSYSDSIAAFQAAGTGLIPVTRSRELVAIARWSTVPWRIDGAVINGPLSAPCVIQCFGLRVPDLWSRPLDPTH
jgi:hypothetical protein